MRLTRRCTEHDAPLQSRRCTSSRRLTLKQRPRCFHSHIKTTSDGAHHGPATPLPLLNLFTILALALPVFLILAHTQREGWKLSPPVYAGIVGMLASFAMMARQSGFLESQIAEV